MAERTAEELELLKLTPLEARDRGLWDEWQALDAKIHAAHRARRAARKAAKPADFGLAHTKIKR